MLGRQSVALMRTDGGARAVWLRGAPGDLEVVRAVEVSASGDEAIGAAIARMKAEKMPVGGVTLGIPGNAATLRYHRLPPVPDWRLQLILKYETEEMAEKSGEPLSSDSLHLEIPESSGEEDVHLLGMGKEHTLVPMLEEAQSAGGRVHRAIPRALGIVHAFLGGGIDEEQETVMLVDIGVDESHLAIVRDGRLLFARTVTFGTSELDDLIARRLDLSLADAKRVRERAAGGKLPAELVDGVGATMRSWTGQLGQLVVSSVTFCRSQTQIRDLDPDRLLLAGPGAALAHGAGISHEGMPARIEKLIPRLSGESLPGAAETWAPVIGLAAAGLDPRARFLDLLPAMYRKKRVFRERTVFLYAAAAALVLAVGVQLLAGIVEHGRAGDVRSTVSEWNGKLDSWNRAEAAAAQANQKYRNREDRLKEEALTGRFHAEILDQLARRIPDAVSISEVRAIRVEGDGTLGVEVRVTGLADNSEGRGIEHARQLQETLRALPLVGGGRAEIQLGDLTEGAYPFDLVLSPDESMPEAGSGRTGRRPGGFRRGSRRQ